MGHNPKYSIEAMDGTLHKEGVALCVGGSSSRVCGQVLGNLIGILVAILHTLPKCHACYIVASKQDATQASSFQILLCTLSQQLQSKTAWKCWIKTAP